MADINNSQLYQAIYSFQGKNNDELCFKKGDIITVTQMEEGGWWEGTLADKTGWFPSNYVKEYLTHDCVNLTKSGSSVQMPVDLPAQQKVYRNLVLRDIIDSEKANVAELQALVKNFLHPLEKSDILSRDEYRQLVSNMNEVLAVQQSLLSSLEDCANRASNEQRIGRVFLSSAPRMKLVHQTYCASHPKAVCIIDKYKDELNSWMESAGASVPGILVLTTGLSKPFRRVDKYAGMLQELERHVEENHPDRGDTQRSVSVYKDIASVCSSTRRQKELELEVMTGGVRGWEGDDLHSLGEIIHMGSVAVGPEHRDRYLVLFPTTLLQLSVSPRMSAFIYEGKLPLTGISVNKLDNTDNYRNAFEIFGPMIERIVAVCQTREDQQAWVDMLRQQIREIRSVQHKSSGPKSPNPPPHGSPHHLIIPSSNNNNIVIRPSNISINAINNINNNHTTSTSMYNLNFNINSNSINNNPVPQPWTTTNLRPSPPLKPNSQISRDDNLRKSTRGPRKINEKNFEEDALILRVIEAYCSSAKARYTINSALLDSPHCAPSEDEKVSCDLSSQNFPVDERSLVDALNALKQQVGELQANVEGIRQQLDQETQARRNLQNVIHAHITNTCPSVAAD